MTSSHTGAHGDQQGPEYLEQGGGAPLPREPRSGRGRRKAVLVGVAGVGVAAVGGGVWAAMSFFATGAQPAEALPDSTLGYASIDLDPSGGQKIEAIRMLNKFPAFKDEIGLDTDDDLKRKLFDESEVSTACEGLDYARDIEPWLGNRAAVAAVDLGEKSPTPVAVLQVTDADAAATGLTRLRGCGSGEEGGWEISGDWAVVAETEELAGRVVDQAASSSLAEGDAYREWTGAVGGAGVLNIYVAPAAGDYLAEHLDDLEPLFGPGSGGPELPDEMAQSLRDFRGTAAALRFDDGALELEAVGDASLLRQSYYDTEAGDDALASLPEDTALAFGVGLQDGWAQQLIDQVAGVFGGGADPGDQGNLVAQAEQWTGLELPEDLETLFGDSTVLALGPDFDPEAFASSADGSDLPIGVKVKGDPAAVEGVLDKLRARIGDVDAGFVGSRSAGDAVAIGPDDDYLGRLVADGGLGDTEPFQDVVREPERAGAIVFVNFNAGGEWLSSLADEDPKAKENLQPLAGFGASIWRDGQDAHGVIRLTTD